MNGTMEAIFASFPASLRRSFTVDHGNEFFGYRQVEASMKTLVYFADPYSAWQRGLSENTNGLLRQYFPKKFDFRSVTQADLDRVVALLNNRLLEVPRLPHPCRGLPLHRLLHLH